MSTETDAQIVGKYSASAIRVFLGVVGVVSLIVGVLILVWPGHTAKIVTAILAIYMIIAGVVYVSLGLFSKVLKAGGRIGHIVLGVVFLVGGVIALANLTATTVWLWAFLGLAVGILWIIEGIAALTLIGSTSHPGISIFFAILSIIAGIVLLFSPLFAAAVLWLLLGIWLVVLGAVHIVQAFLVSKRVEESLAR